MVADVIGMDAAVRLTQAAYGNNQLYVPARDIGPGHRLARALKPDELRTLQRHFGGELLPYATARGARRTVKAERKRRRILELHGQALSVAAIAREVCCSEWYARRVLRKGQASPALPPSPPLVTWSGGRHAGRQKAPWEF
jgi:hypothetical protein